MKLTLLRCKVCGAVLGGSGLRRHNANGCHPKWPQPPDYRSVGGTCDGSLEAIEVEADPEPENSEVVPPSGGQPPGKIRFREFI